MLTKEQIEEIEKRVIGAKIICPGDCGAWKYATDSDEIYSDLRSLLQHIEELENTEGTVASDPCAGCKTVRLMQERMQLLESVLAEAEGWCCQECGQIMSEPADPEAGMPCDCCEVLYKAIHACDTVTTA